ncbi:hypothetical protein P9112_004351 [Eukaryota sp. TZLM1-RC]
MRSYTFILFILLGVLFQLSFGCEELTLAIFKPDLMQSPHLDTVEELIYSSGLTILDSKVTHLSEGDVSEFYFEHRPKPFFNELISFMTEGPVKILVLKGHNAIEQWDLLKYRIRNDYGASLTRNLVHGSDSEWTSKREVCFFFPEMINYYDNKERDLF